jgi:hypothetical protein
MSNGVENVSKFDDAVEISQNNESGAATIALADKIELMISDRGESFTIINFKTGKEKVVSAAWTFKFLSRAFNLGAVKSYEF